MKSSSVKTIIIEMKCNSLLKSKYELVLDASEATADAIAEAYKSADPVLEIKGLPSKKSSSMMLLINKSEIISICVK